MGQAIFAKCEELGLVASFMTFKGMPKSLRLPPVCPLGRHFSPLLYARPSLFPSLFSLPQKVRKRTTTASVPHHPLVGCAGLSVPPTCTGPGLPSLPLHPRVLEGYIHMYICWAWLAVLLSLEQEGLKAPGAIPCFLMTDYLFNKRKYV